MDVLELDRSIERGIRSLAAAGWRHKLLFVVTASLVFGLILAAAIAIRPSFEGSTLLIGGQVDLQQLPNGSPKPVETSSSLSKIAESDEVVEQAIDKVGLQNLDVREVSPNASIFMRLRGFLGAQSPRPEASITPTLAVLPRVKLRLNVRAEPNSDIVRIAFRDHDPVIAAEFANAVAQAFLDRQVELYRRQGAADFFLRERRRFDDELKGASDELQKFSVKTGVYAIDDQRQLLLTRQTNLASALAVTRGAVAQKLGERQALAEQLRKLAPVTRSPFVSSVVDMLAPGSNPLTPLRDTGSKATDEHLTDPPILLVKVYQDSMVTLFKVNSDLAGTQDLEKQQLGEMAKVTADLDALTENEQQFLELKRAVTQATFNSNTYANRMTEEQINDELNAGKFSSIKILQKATVPLRPVFPNYVLFTLVAIVVGSAAGVLAAFLSERSRSGAPLMSRLHAPPSVSR